MHHYVFQKCQIHFNVKEFYATACTKRSLCNAELCTLRIIFPYWQKKLVD